VTANDPAASGPTLPRHTKGKRSQFFADPDLDQMMTFLLELTAEVSVLRERVDTVERLLDANGSVTRAQIEAFEPNAQADAERTAAREALVRRVLRMHSSGKTDAE
jgi:hypothetical protein